MEKIPTAKEMEMSGEFESYQDMMIEFAKRHVKAALKAASINAETEEEAGNIYDPNDRYYVVNKDSILNSYPLENIK